jgi:hypothetical protein
MLFWNESVELLRQSSERWETTSVITTGISAALAILATGLSFIDDKKPLLKKIDRAASLLSASAALIAALALILFTYANRVLKREEDKNALVTARQLKQASEEAAIAYRNLKREEESQDIQAFQQIEHDRGYDDATRGFNAHNLKPIKIQADEAIAELLKKQDLLKRFDISLRCDSPEFDVKSICDQIVDILKRAGSTRTSVVDEFGNDFEPGVVLLDRESDASLHELALILQRILRSNSIQARCGDDYLNEDRTLVIRVGPRALASDHTR